MTTSTNPHHVNACDNCGGQNKNARVIGYLLFFLVDDGVIEEVSLKFFIKGHTKYRSFGQVKRKMSRMSCWNMESLVTAVNEATHSVKPINLERDEQPFWQFKSFFESRYKKIQGIQKCQVFRMTRKKRGFVACRRAPSSEESWRDLRRGSNNGNDSIQSFEAVWNSTQKQ